MTKLGRSPAWWGCAVVSGGSWCAPAPANGTAPCSQLPVACRGCRVCLPGVRRRGHSRGRGRCRPHGTLPGQQSRLWRRAARQRRGGGSPAPVNHGRRALGSSSFGELMRSARRRGRGVRSVRCVQEVSGGNRSHCRPATGTTPLKPSPTNRSHGVHDERGPHRSSRVTAVSRGCHAPRLATAEAPARAA